MKVDQWPAQKCTVNLEFYQPVSTTTNSTTQARDFKKEEVAIRARVKMGVCPAQKCGVLEWKTMIQIVISMEGKLHRDSR